MVTPLASRSAVIRDPCFAGLKIKGLVLDQDVVKSMLKSSGSMHMGMLLTWDCLQTAGLKPALENVGLMGSWSGIQISIGIKADDGFLVMGPSAVQLKNI